MLRTYMKPLVPPAVWIGGRRLSQGFRDLTTPHVSPEVDTLFEGHGAMFAQAVQTAKVYGEYGMGASTEFVANNFGIPLVSVDTSGHWVAKMRSCIARNTAHLIHVNVGPVQNWGRPETYDRRDAFLDYVNSIWATDVRPDVILIDGRFRVASFLTTLLHASPGATIIFDDYTTRQYYHVVEEFVRPSSFNGRQALFYRPEKIDVGHVTAERDRFLYVLD